MKPYEVEKILNKKMDDFIHDLRSMQKDRLTDNETPVIIAETITQINEVINSLKCLITTNK